MGGALRGMLVEYPDAARLAEGLAIRLGESIDRALAERGRACLALAGGSTPFPAYRALAGQPRDWSSVTLVATDERWVPADHAQRNEAAMRRAFASAPGVQILSLVPALPRGEADAGFAEAALAPLDQPFDAVVLGMGADAHTASLFPDSPGLEDAIAPRSQRAAFVVTPQPLPAEAPFPRITLGLSRLQHSRERILAITGEAKRRVWQQVLAAEPSAAQPIGLFLHATAAPVAVHWSP